MALILSGTNNTIRKTDNTAGVRIGNKIAFHAYRQAGHVMGNNSGDVVVVCDTIRFNYGGCYNNNNGRFTAPVAGIYYFSGNGMVTPNVSGDHQLSIRVNGTRYNTSNPGQSSSGLGSAPFWTIATVQLNYNDYVELVHYDSNTNAGLYASGGVWNHFTGYLVG